MPRLWPVAALCLLLLGCDVKQPAAREPLGAPPAPLPPWISGRYELWIGRPTDVRHDKNARWCFVDLSQAELSGEARLQARVWRPGIGLSCEGVEFTRAGVVTLRLRRSLAEDEAVVLSSDLDQPRLAKTEDAGLEPGEEEAPESPDAEEWLLEGRIGEEPGQDEGSLSPIVSGSARVTVRYPSGRETSYTTTFLARRRDVEEDEERASFAEVLQSHRQ